MRTFIAAEITNLVLLDSIKKLQLELEINAKPVSTNNIHFTFLFLGEISDEMSQKVQNSLSSIQFCPFVVNFLGVGAFPKPRFPRVVWVGTDKDSAKNLSDLAEKVKEKLSPLGFRSDKPFSPHVTIFRVKNKIGNITDKLTKFESVTLGTQQISEIKFKKSVLTPEGPIYSDLQVVRAK